MLQDQPENLELAPLSSAECAQWLEETLLVSEWLEDLRLAATDMNALWWWRLGMRLHLTRAGGWLGQVAAWREDAVLLQRDLVGRLEAGVLDRGAARTGLARLTELIPAMHREILRAAGSPWWRMGLALRRLTATVGLTRQAIHTPTENASAVMARFRRWKALPEGKPTGEGSPAAAPPPKKTWQKSRFHWLVLPLAEQGEWPAFGALFRASERRLAAERRDGSSTERPLVTVIMAVRNQAEAVIEAVHSVMDQTWPHWELLVCDDGSDDGTADAACAAGDARVRALRLVRGGAALARNRGLFEARGDYIAYLDTDNLWHPAFLETMVRALEESPGRWCAFARCVETELTAGDTLRLRSARTLEFSHDRLAERNFIHLNALFHRAELPKLFGGFTESLPNGQDWNLALKYTFAQDPLYVDRYLLLSRRAAAGKEAAEFRSAADEPVDTAVAVAENVRRLYAGGLAGPGRGAKRRVTVVSCDLRPGDGARGKALATMLRAGGFDVHEVSIAAAGLPPGHPWDAREHLAALAGGVVVCVGALPYTLGLGTAASAKYGEGVVLDLTEADLDGTGAVADAAAQASVWTTGNPRVNRMLRGRATFLGGYEGDSIAEDRSDVRRVLWAGRPDAKARPTPAELALCVDLPTHVITDRPAERWSAALFWPVMAPAPGYRVDPFVLARAFAAGAPVILGDPAGPDDLVRQEAARWVDPDDDEVLREAIDEVLERRGAARDRAENARRLFQRQFGVRAAVAQFAVVWERAMAQAVRTQKPDARTRNGGCRQAPRQPNCSTPTDGE